jgi:hypothetical protein
MLPTIIHAIDNQQILSKYLITLRIGSNSPNLNIWKFQQLNICMQDLLNIFERGMLT